MCASMSRAPADLVSSSSIAESQVGIGEKIGGIAERWVVGVKSFGKEEGALVGAVVEMVINGLPQQKRDGNIIWRHLPSHGRTTKPPVEVAYGECYR